jgi:hypothetical protein
MEQFWKLVGFGCKVAGTHQWTILKLFDKEDYIGTE